ncbi:Stp1/IreP family PP2C-type Ser/Thr phosphatase [Myxosarcina sp. GI1]|uniref:Stp1/IreP family PP2C-type Ser/Thr phosphatase n=1 Tax=Myxosarcina sp. GI1 TaxID=1541065 RepID=UPI00056B2A53|nr:Stp1/IreP family PP2C-type Ser/Thr phosphatase [Myxosarcina sp. GI1]
MKRHFTGLTDTGIVRTVNQDNYHIDDLGRFCIVADGMGGHAGGQEASKIATEEIKAFLAANWDSTVSSEVLLKEAIEKANQEILADQQQHPERGDMGTTVVVSIFRQEKAWCAHVGDSRLYRWRDSCIEQITEDHTWVGLALKAGEINKEQAKFHPWRHVLSQCLGRKDLHRIDIREIDLKSGDRLLICSDGLTEEVPDDKIESYLSQKISSEAAVKELIAAAKQAGGSDNITAILVAQE